MITVDLLNVSMNFLGDPRNPQGSWGISRIPPLHEWFMRGPWAFHEYVPQRSFDWWISLDHPRNTVGDKQILHDNHGSGILQEVHLEILRSPKESIGIPRIPKNPFFIRNVWIHEWIYIPRAPFMSGSWVDHEWFMSIPFFNVFPWSYSGV